MDMRAGPPGGFSLHADVACDYVVPPQKLSGHSAKFVCKLPGGDVVKVKYGEANGEVFAEVAATRLFWALGFGADAMYPVRLTCHDCPADPWRAPAPRLPSVVFEHATIEHKTPGHEIVTKPDQGWKFGELDLVDELQGGAPRAQRDALVLLAVFVQHGDNKAQNQRLVCLPGESQAAVEGCPGASFLMIQDMGNTFGRGTLIHAPTTGSANFKEWSTVPLWKDPAGCETHLGGNLDHHTLKDPVVGEAGRRFLADLLGRLSDDQIRGMFEAAGIEARQWASAEHSDRNGTVDQWVAAFKTRRDALASRTCPR
jgi:hypothetical protein